MHDIDAHIKQISGQQNYMDKVAQITGNIEFVDMDIWQHKHKQLCASENNIKKLMQQISDIEGDKKISEFENVKNEFEKISNTLNIKDKTFYVKKKGDIKMSFHYKPMKLAQSDWFKCVRRIEKEVNDYVADVIGNNTKEDSKIRANIISKEAENITKVSEANALAIKAIYAKHPEIKDLKFIMGINVTEQNCKQFMLIHQYTRFIINTLLYPMYDVTGKINKSSKQLEKIIKHDIAQSMGKDMMTMEAVKKALESFIVAKYRTTVTGSNEHYLKLFFNLVGDAETSSMDGARFMEMMDSLNIEHLNSDRKAYMFATQAKDMMRKITTGEKLNSEEILGGFKDLFKETESSEIIETSKDFSNDIL